MMNFTPCAVLLTPEPWHVCVQIWAVPEHWVWQQVLHPPQSQHGMAPTGSQPCFLEKWTPCWNWTSPILQGWKQNVCVTPQVWNCPFHKINHFVKCRTHQSISSNGPIGCPCHEIDKKFSDYLMKGTTKCMKSTKCLNYAGCLPTCAHLPA